jgi:hypothetical protein
MAAASSDNAPPIPGTTTSISTTLPAVGPTTVASQPVPTTHSITLHDFKIAHSPPPLSSYLSAIVDTRQNPLDRLPPAEKAKLDQQASKAFIYALKRELNHLNRYTIKQIYPKDIDTILDKDTVTLECKLGNDV